MPEPVEKMSWYYRFMRKLCQVFFGIFYRSRSRGQENFPETGPVLLLSNHQSYFDPIAIAAAAPRRLRALARESLFRGGVFEWMIRSLGAIPVGSAGATLSSLRLTFQYLERGTAMLIFAEGTRTLDGELGPIKPGFTALARRKSPTIVPMAIDGPFQAWPKKNKLPRPGRIAIVFGPPIPPAQIAELSDDEVVALVAERIGGCLADARELRR